MWDWISSYLELILLPEFEYWYLYSVLINSQSLTFQTIASLPFSLSCLPEILIRHGSSFHSVLFVSLVALILHSPWSLCAVFLPFYIQIFLFSFVCSALFLNFVISVILFVIFGSFIGLFHVYLVTFTLFLVFSCNMKIPVLYSLSCISILEVLVGLISHFLFFLYHAHMPCFLNIFNCSLEFLRSECVSL